MGELAFRNRPRKQKSKFVYVSMETLASASSIVSEGDEVESLEIEKTCPTDLVTHSNLLEESITRSYQTQREREHMIPEGFSDDNSKLFDTTPYYYSEIFNHENATNLPLFRSPSFPFPITLSSREKQFFYCYSAYVAHAISVVPQKLNYFLNTFLPMAINDKTILYCLLAWGSIFTRYKEEGVLLISTGQRYILTALNNLKNSVESGKCSFICALTSYTILMCIEITIGDIETWSSYLTECYNLINKMGGFQILKNYSSEGKILAQNFAYFDILASQSNENGTYYPVSEYVDIYNLENVSLTDSLQGCIRPLILILGEAINLVVESKSILQNVLEDDLFHEYQGIVFEKCDQIERKLDEADLNPLDLMVLNENDMENHLQMFELYQLSIKLYIKHVIRRLPPVVPEMQFLFYKIKKYLKILMNSSVKMSLCFPLLICGLVAVTLLDREELERLIVEFESQYEFNNAKKIHFIVKEIWNLNQSGTLYVDWFNVTKRFGWRLNLGR